MYDYEIDSALTQNHNDDTDCHGCEHDKDFEEESCINDPFHSLDHDFDPIMIAARSEYRDNNSETSSSLPRWRRCTEPIISILDKPVPDHAFHDKKESLNIVALGRTGDGKSSLLNDMLGKEAFYQKQSAKSQTKDIQTCHGFWAPLDRYMHDKEDFGCFITAIDTPGFGDSMHRDESFLAMIQDALLNVALEGGIHCILLTFKINTNSDIIFKTIDTFSNLISPLIPPTQQPSIWENVLFVFTHVDLHSTNGYYTVNSRYHSRKIALKSKISRVLKEKYSVTVDVPLLWVSTKSETCESLKRGEASKGIKECDCELRYKYHSDTRRRLYEQVWKRRITPFVIHQVTVLPEKEIALSTSIDQYEETDRK